METSGSQPVTFKTVGTHTFTITCTPEKGDIVSKDFPIVVSKDDSSGDSKGISASNPEPGVKGDYRNDCSIEIDKDTFVYNVVENGQAQSVNITFSCKGEAKKESGHDVRPTEYGLFINETIGSQTKRYDCTKKESKNPGKYLDGSEVVTGLSCNFSEDKFKDLFGYETKGADGKITIVPNNNLKMLVAYAKF
jgi:hypothetical protein